MRATQPLRRLLTVSVLSFGLLNLSGSGTASAQRPGDEARTLRALRATAGSALRMSRHAETGRVRFLGSAHGRPIESRRSFRGMRAETVARGFLQRNAVLFGASANAAELRHLRSTARPGGSAVRFQQVKGGVPVLGGEFVVALDRNNSILSVNGEASAAPPVGGPPAISSARAAAIATAVVARDRAVGTSALRTTAPKLHVYDPALLGVPGNARASRVWLVPVRGTGTVDVSRVVLVDAATGFVRLNFDPDPKAKRRIVCDRNNRRADPDACEPPFAITEGGSTARASEDAFNAYLYAGDTYDYFLTRFGRDSLDGKGLPLRSTVRYCPENSDDASFPAPCPYPNAYWNGDELQMVYGAGFASADDVVAHELTHGVTQFEANLFSLYQSGAVNESISDVFGELIDQYNASIRNRGRDSTGDAGSVDYRWLLFEDAPGGFGRDMSNPRTHKEPDRMRSGYYSAENEWSDRWDNGGVHTNSGVGNKAAYFMAVGGEFNHHTIDPADALGNEKLAQLYYRALTQHLTSGSDYADLADALRQSCAELVAGGPLVVAGTSLTFTATDCGTVLTAVEATQMYLQPIVRQRRNPDGSLETLDATNPEAPVCDPGAQPSYLFYDSLEHPQVGNWETTSRLGESEWFYPQNPNPFGLELEYAKSGRKHMFGDNPELRSDFAISTTREFVPTATSYLRIDHAHIFDFNYESGVGVDSGVAEYSVDGGRTYRRLQPDAGHGYGPIADRATGNNSVIQGEGFVGDSHGYVSTRFFLGDLSGQPVTIRFRIGTDSRFGNYGWFVDDIRIYDCAAANVAPTGPPPPPADVTVSPVEDGVAVSWSSATRPTGILGYTIIARSASQTATVSVPTGTTSHTLRGLSAAEPYTVTVRARSAFGDSLSPPSDPVTPVDARPPGRPSAMSVAPGERAAVVSWAPDALSYSAGARVVVKAGATPPRSPADGRAIDVATATSTRVSGLAPNTAYAFAVFPRDRLGNFATPPAVARVDGSALTVVLDEPPAGAARAVVSGVLRNSNGAVVGGARVDLMFRTPGAPWSLHDVMVSTRSGTFEFEVFASSGEAQVRFRGGRGLLGSASAVLPVSAAK